MGLLVAGCFKNYGGVAVTTTRPEPGIRLTLDQISDARESMDDLHVGSLIALAFIACDVARQKAHVEKRRSPQMMRVRLAMRAFMCEAEKLRDIA